MRIMLKLGPWPLRLLWLALPFTLGDVLGEALTDTASTFRTSVSAAAWAGWVVVLLASVVALPSMLTIVRTAAPATIPVAVWSGVDAGFGTDAGLAAALAAVLTVVALAPTTGASFIDGPSYGSERRLGLRTPAALLAGPVELAWIVVVAGLTVGPLLLAAEQTVAGIIATLVGFPAAFIGFRSLLSLSRRWLVFVPTGLVVHDHLAMGDPVLFPKQLIDHVGPAREGTPATDLTGRALGLAIEIDLSDPVKAELVEGASDGLTPLEGLLITPSLPAEVLDEAEARRLRVG